MPRNFLKWTVKRNSLVFESKRERRVINGNLGAFIFIVVMFSCLIVLPLSERTQSSIKTITFEKDINIKLAYGLSVHASWNDINDRTISIFVNSGAKWVRTDWDMNCNMNAFVKFMKSNDIKILGILDHWTMKFSQNFTLSDWAWVVNETIKRYPKVDAWEIWNEPNVPLFHFGYMDGSPEHYVEMLRVAYNIIKAKSNASVLFAGLSPIRGWDTWLSRCYDLGASNFCDNQGQHLYDDAQTNVQVLMKTYQITRKSVWVTELGRYSIFPYTELEQANFMVDNFGKLEELGRSYYWIDKVFWYSFSDYANLTDDDPEKHFGLIRSDYSLKPSYYTFEAYACTSEFPNEGEIRVCPKFIYHDLRQIQLQI